MSGGLASRRYHGSRYVRGSADLTQTRDELDDIRRPGRLELQRAIVVGMSKCQPTRVQSTAPKRDLSCWRFTVDVPRFADERVDSQRRLQTDLVPSPGPQPHLDQRGIAQTLQHAV